MTLPNFTQGGKPRCWIDFDLNHTRDAYQLAKDFVEACDLTYSLSSNLLERLTNAELRKVKEIYFPNDHTWSQKGRIAVKMPPERITFELDVENAPYEFFQKTRNYD